MVSGNGLAGLYTNIHNSQTPQDNPYTEGSGSWYGWNQQNLGVPFPSNPAEQMVHEQMVHLTVPPTLTQPVQGWMNNSVPVLEDVDMADVVINVSTPIPVVVGKYIWWLQQNGFLHKSSAATKFATDYGVGGAYGNYLAQRTMAQLLNETEGHEEAQKKKVKRLMETPDLEFNDVPVKRRVQQPRFKLEYDTLDDATRRLAESVIYVGNIPVYIRELHKGNDDIILIIETVNKKMCKLLYKQNKGIDLRTPEPQYLTMYGKASRLIRPPARQQTQGLRYDNSFLIKAGGKQSERWESSYDLIRALSKSDNVLLWDNVYSDLFLSARSLRTLRLSSNVAAYLCNETEEKIIVEYKGRNLGELSQKNKTVSVDELDAGKHWIKRDLQNVGLKMEAKNA